MCSKILIFNNGSKLLGSDGSRLYREKSILLNQTKSSFEANNIS